MKVNRWDCMKALMGVDPNTQSLLKTLCGRIIQCGKLWSLYNMMGKMLELYVCINLLKDRISTLDAVGVIFKLYPFLPRIIYIVFVFLNYHRNITHVTQERGV